MVAVVRVCMEVNVMWKREEEEDSPRLLERHLL
jgi:hypothetical protein